MGGEKNKKGEYMQDKGRGERESKKTTVARYLGSKV